MRRVFRTSASLLGVALACAVAQGAAAQSVDIPLNYALNTFRNFGGSIPGPVVILTINVGVNGGAAQAYAFDTGSAVFLTPNGVFSGTPLAPNVDIDTYGGIHTFGGDLYQIPASSLKFYAAQGATSGGVTLSSSGVYNVGSYTTLNGGNPGMQPFGTAVVGAFGADPQAFTITPNGGTPIGMGGILGQTLLPNTTPGYVVSANGQSLAALNLQLGTSIPGGPVTNAPQAIRTVPQSVTSCNPCVTVGLTPALVAQFLPLNTVTSTPLGIQFPNSNVESFNKFVPFNFTLSSPLATLTSQSVSLDSGFTDIHLYTSPTTYPTGYPNPVLTISANSGGTQEAFNVINENTPPPSTVPSPYTLVNTNTTAAETSFLGIGFFVQNSVLYNLAGQQVGYSPNFVTDATISTTAASPLVIGASSVPLGLAGVISGPGGVFITNGGSASLSGTNSYTGPTSVSGGYLALLGPGSIAASSGINVSAGGIFDISGTNNGASIRSLAGDQSGMVWLGSQTLTLTAAQDVFAGTIAGSGGLTLTGGFEALTGTNVYTGPTSINGGLLLVDGIIAGSSNVSVNATGTLGGTGIVDPLTVTINSGGTLAPGTPGGFGTLTIDGTLLFNAGSFYAINIGPGAGNNSKTAVIGSATLGGNGTVVVSPQLGRYSGAVYQILSTTTGLNGTFAGLTVNGNFVGGMSLDYASNPGNVDLNVSGVSLLATPLGANQNQQNVINGINNGILNGPANTPLPTQFLSLGGLSGPSLLNAVTQLDGEANTGAERAAVQLTNQFLALMLDPFVYGRGGVGSTSAAIGFAPDEPTNLPPDIALAYASILTKAPKPPTFEQRWTAWGSAFGGSNTANGDPAAGSSNITASTFGFASGMDYHLSPHTVFGFALAGAGTNWGLASTPGSGRSDAMQIGGYGITWFGPAYLAGALSFTNHWFTTNRTALGDALTANFVGQSYGARLEGGYRYPVLPAFAVTPYGAVQFQDFNTPAYSESDVNGGGFGLSYAAMNATDVRSELGARLDDLAVVRGMPLVLFGRLAWAHDFVSNPSLSAAFEALPGAGFTVNGAPIPHDSALTTAGAQLFLTPDWTLLAKFDGEFAPGSQTYAGTGTLRYTW
jgi:autotransporter-associated beta strand protein